MGEKITYICNSERSKMTGKYIGCTTGIVGETRRGTKRLISQAEDRIKRVVDRPLARITKYRKRRK